jgi:hypothetical protein
VRGWRSAPLAALGLCFYYALPDDSLCFMSSTTLPELKLRVGGAVVELHRAAKERHPWLPGTEVAADSSVTHTDAQGRKDPRRGIRLLATTESDGSWRGLKGVGTKAPRMAFVGDELSLMSPTFSDAIGNLSVNPIFRFVGLGNPVSRDDPLGQLSEPVAGWASLGESTEVRTWATRQGLCLQLPGLSTPNRAGEPVRYPYLITHEFIEQQRRLYGDSDLRFRAFALGALPSGSGELNVVDNLLLDRLHAREPARFALPFTLFAGLDASFGGSDRCALALLAVGPDARGNTLIEQREVLVLPVARGADATAEESVARACRRGCEARQVPPQRLGFDCTFGPLGSALAREWSTACIPVNFAGTPVDPPTDRAEVELTEQQFPPSERFGKRVSQIVWRFREVVEAGAFRGLREDAAQEFAHRRYSVRSKTGHAVLLDVEPKDAYRARMRSSSDLADATSCALEAVAASGVTLRPIRSDYDREPAHDPTARLAAEARVARVHSSTTSNPDADPLLRQSRLEAVAHDLARLQHPHGARVAVVPGRTELRMAVHSGPPDDDDANADANAVADAANRRALLRGLGRIAG